MFEYHGIIIRPEEILIYLRKSRTDDPLLTIEEVLERHEKILKEWCERNLGGVVPEENIFREIVSGETIAARPDFQKILRLVEDQKYKAILTVDAQRLSRGDLEDAGRIIKLLRYTDTLVIVPEMVFDLNDEYGRERFKRELERGNDYLEYYKKINLRGRLESVKDGWFVGSRPPFGYDKTWDTDGKRRRPTLAINEREAEQVRLIFDWYVNEDMGTTNISHRLDEMGYKPRNGERWSMHTVKNILENVHYIGKIKWYSRKTVNVVEDGEIIKTYPRMSEYLIYDGRHPAIIDDDTFQRAQEKRGRNHKAKAKTKLRNPLAGVVYCQCGRAMSYREYKRPDGTHKAQPRMVCDGQDRCSTQSVLYSDIYAKIVDVLRNCAADFEMMIKNDGAKSLQKHADDIQRMETRLAELIKKELTLWEKYTEESMPKSVFENLNEKVVQEKEALEQSIEKAKRETPTVADYQDRIMRFTDAINALEDPKASALLKNKLLKACIEKIVYSRERGTRWNMTDFELDVTLRA